MFKFHLMKAQISASSLAWFRLRMKTRTRSWTESRALNFIFMEDFLEQCFDSNMVEELSKKSITVEDKDSKVASFVEDDPEEVFVEESHRKRRAEEAEGFFFSVCRRWHHGTVQAGFVGLSAIPAGVPHVLQGLDRRVVLALAKAVEKLPKPVPNNFSSTHIVPLVRGEGIWNARHDRRQGAQRSDRGVSALIDGPTDGVPGGSGQVGRVEASPVGAPGRQSDASTLWAVPWPGSASVPAPDIEAPASLDWDALSRVVQVNSDPVRPQKGDEQSENSPTAISLEQA
ncbi:hypothetical protein BGZ65_006535 [Modicella reniformis]|uniref:Uncharacterized protein n=1 Tax=Modicella reniformis TaxID=1440133 RepID=A0A9P6J5M7_9FUNG|nr:hypothetical protein BGZ65_006535 [Modicella reniformis]